MKHPTLIPVDPDRGTFLHPFSDRELDLSFLFGAMLVGLSGTPSTNGYCMVLFKPVAKETGEYVPDADSNAVRLIAGDFYRDQKGLVMSEVDKFLSPEGAAPSLTPAGVLIYLSGSLQTSLRQLMKTLGVTDGATMLRPLAEWWFPDTPSTLESFSQECIARAQFYQSMCPLNFDDYLFAESYGPYCLVAVVRVWDRVSPEIKILDLNDYVDSSLELGVSGGSLDLSPVAARHDADFYLNSFRFRTLFEEAERRAPS